MSKVSLDNEMDNMYFDVLREIGNIGAGNATTALAQLLNKKLDMSVPKIELVPFNKLGSIIGGEEEVVVGIYLFLEDDISGSMMFLLSKDAARQLVNDLMGMYTNAQSDFGEMELSALQEIGNIITGAYLSALSGLTHLKITASIPYLTIDMAGAILSVPAIEFGILGDEMLLIQSQIYDEIAIDGFFIMVPDVDSYKKILTSLGLPV